MRKFLSSTILGSALLVTAMGGGYSAQAAQKTILEPNSDWAVTKIDNSVQHGGKAYCAMARRYTNGIVLTFARNHNDQTSIAIDFQSPQLDTSKTYDVKLDAGFGRTRDFQVRPVSSQAFVVKVGADYPFLEALGRSSEMEASVGGQDFLFEMKDYSEGQSHMNGCLVSLVQPAAGGDDVMAPITPIVPAAPAAQSSSNGAKTSDLTSPPLVQSAPSRTSSDDISTVPEKLTETEQQIRNLQQENDRLRSALKKERRDFENKYMAQSADSSASIELNEKVQLLEAENNRLKQQVGAMKNATMNAGADKGQIVKMSANMADLKGQLDQLKQENTGLKSQLVKAQNNAASLAKTQSAQDAQNVMAQDLKQRISLLEGQNKDLQTQVASLKSGKQSADNTKAKADADALAGMKAQIEKLQQVNRDLRGQLGQAQAQINSKPDGMADADKIALQNKIDALTFQNKNLQSKVARQESDLQALAQNQTSQKVIADLQGRVEKLRAQNQDLSDTLANMHTASTDTPSMLLSKVHVLEVKLDSVQKDRDSLLAKMDRISKDREGNLLTISSKDWNLEKATKRYNEAEREIQRLGRELEKTKTNCASEKKEIEYMLFDPSIATQQQIQRISAAENKAQMADKLLVSQKARYEDQIAGMKQKIAGYESQVASLQKDMAGLQNKYAANYADYQKVQGGRQQELLSKVASYQGKIKELTSAMVVANSKLDEASHQVASLSSKQESQQKIASSLTADKAYLAKKAAKLESENIELSQKLKQTALQVASLSSKQESQQKIASSLTADKAYLAKKAAKLESENAQLSQKLEQTSQQIASLQNAVRMSKVESAAGAASAPIQREELPSRASAPKPASEGASVAQLSEQQEKTALPRKIVRAIDKDVSGQPAAMAQTQSGADMISSILHKAGVPLSGGIQSQGVANGISHYSWKAKGLFGSAEEQSMASNADFENMMKAYIAKTKARCGGDFAASESGRVQESGSIAVSYEVACVGKEASASASLAFIARDGRFIAIAHEAGLDDMDVAMDMRDKIMGTVMPVNVASR